MKIGKRESQRLEKRAQIIAIARQHFFERGYENTTMSGIAAQLGGSKRTLWAHFTDKEDLFAAFVMDTAAGIRAQIEYPDGNGDPLDRLTRLCRSVIDRALSPMVMAMFRLVGAVGDRQPELGRIFFDKGPGETQRMIGEYLRDNFADVLWTRDFRAAGVDLVVFSSAAMNFARMWSGAVPSSKEKDAQARRSALLFLRAYAREPERYVTDSDMAAVEAGAD